MIIETLTSLYARLVGHKGSGSYTSMLLSEYLFTFGECIEADCKISVWSKLDLNILLLN